MPTSLTAYLTPDNFRWRRSDLILCGGFRKKFLSLRQIESSKAAVWKIEDHLNQPESRYQPFSMTAVRTNSYQTLTDSSTQSSVADI